MLIKIEDLSKRYSCKPCNLLVFEKLSFSVKKGEFIAITGKSGCGKSTLLRTIGCLENYDKGKYYFDGREVSSFSEVQLAHIRNKKIGFVFQNFNLIPEYTVYENIEVPLGYRGISSRKRKQKIMGLLYDIDLVEKQNVYPSQLSGGQQQRIAIARALANDPVLLLADEPTGNLDRDNALMIMSLFKRLNDQGLTIVMVTHDAYAASFANRIINFDDILVQREG